MAAAPVNAPLPDDPWQATPPVTDTVQIVPTVPEWVQDEVTAYKTEREEFSQAEQFAIQRKQDVSGMQQKLDVLMEQKAARVQELAKAKAKAAAAKEELNKASTTGAVEEIEKWRNEAGLYDTRVKSAVLELEKVESDINEAVQSLQLAIKGSPESDLLLPGESIEIRVAEDDSFNNVYPIRRGGYIILPRVGRVALAGKNLKEAELAIRDALQVNQLRQATVIVERPEGGVTTDPIIYLVGEFTQPGTWKIPQNMSPTIVTTILRAGGLTAVADLSRVRLLRLVNGRAMVEQVNVQAILKGDGLAADVTVQPGDVIIVPPSAKVVYVTGSVRTPGVLRLRPDDELTAYSAILRAGGFARFANRGKVYVLRDRGNGVKVRIPVNIKALQAGSRSDLVLQSKDIVVVPEKFFSF